MQKRWLGKSGIEVSIVGLGTVKFGRNQGVKYPHSFVLPSDADIIHLLGVAADLGINLLDTAPAYGSSEERLGKLLHGKRHEWIISTKVGEEFVAGESQFDFSAPAVISSIERSLARLHTDYLDIVLVHSNGDDQRIIEKDNIFATLASLKSAGKIRAFGMSTKTIQGGLLTVDLADIAMVSFNKDYQDELPVLLHAQQKQKGIFIKKALASGHYAGSMADNLRFITQQPGVTSVVVGTLNADHLRENTMLLFS